MNNLPINGVPKNLKNTVFPFEYNNFEQLSKIVKMQKIGVIKMEVKRISEPQNNFLQKIRKLATENNIVLIFDECTSGFRQTFGGLHKFYNVEPDLAIFGKALGNGYAINAVIGRRAVMEHANHSFISSTFWTERVGPSAALETLKIMEKNKSWNEITMIGKNIKKQIRYIASLHKLDLQIEGIDAIPNFYFNSNNNMKYKTLITQEMLKKKILASNLIFCSISHKDKVLKKYFNTLEGIFSKISKVEKGQKDITDYLKSPIAMSGMRNK